MILQPPGERAFAGNQAAKRIHLDLNARRLDFGAHHARISAS
jgi:hypothetical protein